MILEKAFLKRPSSRGTELQNMNKFMEQIHKRQEAEKKVETVEELVSICQHGLPTRECSNCWYRQRDLSEDKTSGVCESNLFLQQQNRLRALPDNNPVGADKANVVSSKDDRREDIKGFFNREKGRTGILQKVLSHIAVLRRAHACTHMHASIPWEH